MLPPASHRGGLGRFARRSRLLVALLTFPLLGTCVDARANERSGARRLVALLLRERFTTGRLSGQTAWSRCVAEDTSAIVPQQVCGAGAKRGTRYKKRIDVAQAALPPAEASSESTERLHAEALFKLVYSRSESMNVDTAVAALVRASELDPGSATLLNDLAVAYSEQAERDTALTSAIYALDVVERAAAIDSTSLSILFNRALFRESLYLIETAKRYWKLYLDKETDPRWIAEAKRHLDRLQTIPAMVDWGDYIENPPETIDEDSILARVKRSPQQSLEAAINLLGVWGMWLQCGDSARASRALAVARAIGNAARVAGADQSIRLQVAAIDQAAGDSERTWRLAEGHMLLADAMEYSNSISADSALQKGKLAEERLGESDSSAGRWARYSGAMSQVEKKNYRVADRMFQQIRRAASDLEMTLQGKATSSRGVVQIRQGHYDNATAFYEEASLLYDSAQETDQKSFIHYVVSESLTLGGRAKVGRQEAFRGLRSLAPFRKSKFLNNQLSNVAFDAYSQNLPYAALAISDEVFTIVDSIQGNDKVPLALRARARYQIALGQLDSARANLARANRLVAAADSGAARDRVQSDVNLAVAELFMAEGQPELAAEFMSRVIRNFLPIHLPTAYYLAGMAADSAGDRAGARHQFHAAIDSIESMQQSFSDASTRAGYLETVEKVYDAVIGIELDSGRPDSAFRYLERGREAAWKRLLPSGDTLNRISETGIAAVQATLDDDELLLDYALLRDRVVIWAISRDGWRQHEVPVGRDSVARLVRRLLRTDVQSVEVRPGDARAALYDILLQPVDSALARARSIAVIPDRELHEVPFIALWNRRAPADSRYVLHRWTVRTEPNATFLLEPPGPTAHQPPALRALVVGNPELADSTELRSLDSAEAEAKIVANSYGVRPLLRDRATKSVVMRQMQQAGVFHFAGHAVFNRDQPELSYLALAPDSAGGDGLLYAREIGELSLSNLTVAILSACSTLNPRPSRSGATAGLANSFLRGGVPGTVSTLWDVYDDDAKVLLVAFHRHLRDAEPAEALRRAQLEILKGNRPPSEWAGFIYTGR